MTDPIKAKIIELVPEIMELKDGCDVYWTYEHALNSTARTPVTKRGTVVREAHYQPFGRAPLILLYGNKGTKEIPANQLTVLGRPITLADVLRAIPAGVYMKSLGEQVRFVAADDNSVLGPEYWDLSLDYDGQTQEVKDFIGKLFNV